MSSFDLMPGVRYLAREGLTPQGHGRIYVDYLWDVGNLHVIDYHLWLADLPIRRYGEAPRSLRFSPADWGR